MMEDEVEETPTTVADDGLEPESEDDSTELFVDIEDPDAMNDEESLGETQGRQLGPGPPPPTQMGAGPPPPQDGSAGGAAGRPAPQTGAKEACANAFTNGPEHFCREETMFVFDWDDTVLPSSWVQGQGLRLDSGSTLSAEQAEQLAEVADVAAKTLRAAKRHGSVVLITNAERGWIELSCLKFLPKLCPILEDVRIVSARTTYEGPASPSPLDWKLNAFEVEINRHFTKGGVNDKSRRKNVFSLGDSVHEREALLRATTLAPNCRAKSLKFVERPDVSQLCKQHELITGSFEQMVHHDGNLDLCIRCP